MKYEEWVKSVHQADGLSERVENEIRKDIVTFMIILGKHADLGTSAIAKAIFIFHKFSKLLSFKRINFLLYASCCIFISAKFDDTPLKLDVIARMFLTMNLVYRELRTAHPLGSKDLEPSDFPVSIFKEIGFEQKAIELTCDSFTTAEAEILMETGYDLDIDLPYSYIKMLEEENSMIEESLVDTAMAVVNKSWQTILCLYFEPKVIAMGALIFAQELNRRSSKDTKLESAWRKVFGDVNQEEVEEVTKYLKELN